MAKKRKAPAPVEEPADAAPGWDAIDAACEHLYPTQTNPYHIASVPHPPFTGDGLIYGISAYKAEAPKHWHLVTYGFSELYAKESDDPAVSGWGFELTFRLVRGREKQPPDWAFNFLMNLGRYVRRSHNPFGSGHMMDLNGPICLGSDTAIRAIAFTADSQFGAIDTPNGRLEFLQVVGLANDEYEACGDWHTAAVLDVLRRSNPLLLTDLKRRSILETPSAAATIRAGIDREGSQSDRGFATVVDWKTGRGKTRSVVVTVGAGGVQLLVPKLRSRLGHGRDFTLVGRERAVRFRSAKRAGWKSSRNLLKIDLTPKALAAVQQTLQPVRGRYSWPEVPGLTIDVQPSQITDSTGKVVEVIG
jgi:hypothetical protein